MTDRLYVHGSIPLFLFFYWIDRLCVHGSAPRLSYDSIRWFSSFYQLVLFRPTYPFFLNKFYLPIGPYLSFTILNPLSILRSHWNLLLTFLSFSFCFCLYLYYIESILICQYLFLNLFNFFSFVFFL